MPCTTALRTVRDLCRVLPFEEAVVAADSALRQRLVRPARLRRTLSGARGPAADRLRRVGAAVHPGAGSVLETLLRLLLAALDLPPEPQVVVRDRDGVFVARVDFCWRAARLVVEADGFAFHRDRAAYRRDRERQNQLVRLGWRVLRFTWEDVTSRPAHVLALVEDCLAA